MWLISVIHMTGSVSGRIEVMNLLMKDILPILLFLQESLTYLCSTLFGTYFAQNSASKIYQYLLLTFHVRASCELFSEMALVIVRYESSK